jgi:PIN domain nuclease of toxin-antitoxin system
MRILIDTHTFLWFVTEDSKLSDRAFQTIEDEASDIILSISSLWEIAIKFSIGKLKLKLPFQEFMDEQIQINEFQLLTIQPTHLNIVAGLPLHHRDPFDRILIAQAITENVAIISADKVFDAYGVVRLW